MEATGHRLRPAPPFQALIRGRNPRAEEQMAEKGDGHSHTDTPHSAFSYEDNDPAGPKKWATLNKEFELCDSGTKQSPIDIEKVEVTKDLGPLEPAYKAGAATVKNRGHDFMLNWTGGNGNLKIEGKEYTLVQAHWHAPSEHTFNGTRFDAEMHMVHEDSTKSKAVVSVLFSSEAGKSSKLLSNLKPYFEKLAGKEHATEEVKDPVDPGPWIDKASGYYRYEGSFTTLPCTEGVIWTILSKVADASKEEIELIKSRKVGSSDETNERPIQKTNSRVIRYYKAGSTEAKGAPGPRKAGAT